jgi:hypothetical protein
MGLVAQKWSFGVLERTAIEKGVQAPCGSWIGLHTGSTRHVLREICPA